MRGRKKQSVGIVCLILILAATVSGLLLKYRASSDDLEAKSSEIPGEAGGRPPSKEPVVLTTDFDWDSQEESWFEDVMAQVAGPEETQATWEYRFDETLKPGESLITDGWELAEGVFQFTVLTPTEVELNGETVYQISAGVTEIDLSGQTENVAMPQVLTRNGMKASLQIIQGQPLNASGKEAALPEQGYRLEITPQDVSGGIRLSGRASATATKP